MLNEARLQALVQRIAAQSAFVEISLLCADIFGKIYKKNALALVSGENKALDIKNECSRFKEYLAQKGEDADLSDEEICRVANSVIKIKLL